MEYKIKQWVDKDKIIYQIWSKKKEGKFWDMEAIVDTLEQASEYINEKMEEEDNV